MINTAEQHQISGLGFITTPDAFIPWRGVKVSGIVLFLKLMTLCQEESASGCFLYWHGYRTLNGSFWMN